MAQKYTIWYPKPQHHKKHPNRDYYLERLIKEFEIRGIKHDGNQTFVQLNSQSSWDGLRNMSKSSPKMAVAHVDYGDENARSFVEKSVLKGKYYCYSLRQKLLFRTIFDATYFNIFEKVKSINQRYGEAGFKQVWAKWEEFKHQLLTYTYYWDYSDGVYHHYLSFKNLLSFVIIYVVLLSCYIGGLILELAVYMGPLSLIGKIMANISYYIKLTFCRKKWRRKRCTSNFLRQGRTGIYKNPRKSMETRHSMLANRRTQEQNQ